MIMNDTTTAAGSTQPPKALLAREAQRNRERVSRERRKEKIDEMRCQVETLECAVSALSFVSDADAIWDEFLSPQDKRVRRFLRDSIKLLDEAMQLRLERDALRKLLTDYETAKRVIAQMLKEVTNGDWHWNVQRWRAFTRLHFHPWTLAECQTEIEAGLQDMNKSLYGTGTLETTGLSFLGWRDQRRIDPNTNTLHFSLYKTFRGHDMQRHMDQYWISYHTPELYVRLVLGKGVVSLDILQEVAPHVSIVRYVEQYPGIPINAHFLYLLYRVETEDGFTQCLRSIDCPDLRRATDGEHDVWASNFFWFRWEMLGDTSDLTHTDYRLTIGGSLAGEDAQYAARWMGEVLASTVRGEQFATGRPLLQFTS